MAKLVSIVIYFTDYAMALDPLEAIRLIDSIVDVGVSLSRVQPYHQRQGLMTAYSVLHSRVFIAMTRADPPTAPTPTPV